MAYIEMAEDVVTSLDAQSIDRAVLVGHSMGGKVAQTVALLHPERVAGLVVLDMAPVSYHQDVDPSWRAVYDIVTTLTELELADPVSGEPYSKQEVDKQLQKGIPDPALRAFVWTNLDAKAMRWKIPIDTIAEQLDTIAGFDVSPSSQYHGDVMFIQGGQSRFVRHAHMETISKYFPNHMLTTIRGAGHWVHAEAPDDTVALLKRYLDR